MDRLSRYIFSQLLVSTLLITVILTTVVWLAQALRFVEMIINQGISMGMFIYLVALLLPGFLILIVPFALFAAVLFVYNRLVQDRELAVMRAAGLSQTDLIRPAVILSVLAIALLYFLYFHLVPITKGAFKDLRWEIRNGYSQVVLQEGRFNVLSDNITVYVRERSSSGEILGILARDSRNPIKPFTLMAARGALVREGDATRIVMQDGNRQEVNRDTGALSILYFDKYTFDLGLKSGTAGARNREADEMSLNELLNPEQVADIPPMSRNAYRISGHSRIVTPLYTLAFVMMGLAALLSGNFTRRSMTRRISGAVIVVIIVKMTSLGIEKFIIKHLALAPLLYVVVTVCVLAPAYLIFRNPPMPMPRPRPRTTGAEA